MATQITRPAMVDDSGTPAAPNEDGTLVQASFFTTIFDNIDAMLTGATHQVDAVLDVTAHGAHDFTAGGAGGNVVTVRNTTSGTGNYAAVHLGDDADADSGRFEAYTSLFSETAVAKQNGIAVRALGAGGISLSAEEATADVRLLARGLTKSLTFNGDQVLSEGSIGGDHAYMGVLRDSINTTTQGTPASTAKTTLHSFSLPAGALAVDGQAIQIWAFFSLAPNANTKHVGIDFGATPVFGDVGLGFFGGSAPSGTPGAIVQATIIRTGAATQKAFGWSNTYPGNTSYGRADADVRYTTPAETLSGAITIAIWGQNGTAAANDVQAEFSFVKYLV